MFRNPQEKQQANQKASNYALLGQLFAQTAYLQDSPVLRGLEITINYWTNSTRYKVISTEEGVYCILPRDENIRSLDEYHPGLLPLFAVMEEFGIDCKQGKDYWPDVAPVSATNTTSTPRRYLKGVAFKQLCHYTTSLFLAGPCSPGQMRIFSEQNAQGNPQLVIKCASPAKCGNVQGLLLQVLGDAISLRDSYTIVIAASKGLGTNGCYWAQCDDGLGEKRVMLNCREEMNAIAVMHILSLTNGKEIEFGITRRSLEFMNSHIFNFDEGAAYFCPPHCVVSDTFLVSQIHPLSPRTPCPPVWKAFSDWLDVEHQWLHYDVYPEQAGFAKQAVAQQEWEEACAQYIQNRAVQAAGAQMPSFPGVVFGAPPVPAVAVSAAAAAPAAAAPDPAPVLQERLRRPKGVKKSVLSTRMKASGYSVRVIKEITPQEIAFFLASEHDALVVQEVLYRHEIRVPGQGRISYVETVEGFRMIMTRAEYDLLNRTRFQRIALHSHINQPRNAGDNAALKKIDDAGNGLSGWWSGKLNKYFCETCGATLVGRGGMITGYAPRAG